MERVWSTSGRGFSVRSILVFVLTVFITALLWATFGSQTQTNALEGFDATWKGESLIYDGGQYYAAPDAVSGESHGLEQGTHYYVYIEEVVGSPKTQKAHVIYFAPGADPPTATVATYVAYDYSASKVFSNPTGEKDIDVVVRGEESGYSSCSVDGIGWIICPVAVFLAEGMDNIFDLVKGFLEVQPSVLGDSNDPLYVAWNIMRSVANVAFIIVFLIIIYSQITNVAVSNYGLKKLLPRLIIAAILVNVSFIITALAVDISNIIGYSLQDIFIKIREDTFAITNSTWSAETTKWADITGFVLSGGAITGGIVAFSVATGGALTLGGAIYLLLPLLVGLILTILFVLLILAARQAIIVILIVIGPLAFVAYLLPNTEGWFKKWRDLFMTMLIFFPAFSLVFGGSQLAGGIIIQNATSIFMMIFGLAVQVAPLVITPLLLKLSGGLLGRIAGIVNDPRKGVLDRTKNLSRERTEMRRLRSLQKPTGANPFRRIAQRIDDNGRNVKGRTGLYTAQNDNRYHQTSGYESINQQEYATDLTKKAIENRHTRHNVASATLRGSNLNIRALELEDTKVALDATNSAESAMYAEYRSGKYKTGGDQRLKAIRSSIASHVMENSVQLQRKQSAESLQIELFAKQMEKSKAMRVTAGGVQGETGAQRALAIAIAAQSKAHDEAVSNAASILSHYNYDDEKITSIAIGEITSGIKVKVTNDIVEAAIAKIAGGANTSQILRLMENIEIDQTDANLDFRATFADKLLANGNKPKFASAGMLSNAKQGVNIPPKGKGRLDTFVAQAINDDKFGSADLLVSQDKEYLKTVLATLRDNESGIALGADKLHTIRQSIELAKKNPLFAGKIAERKDVLDEIYAELAAPKTP